MLNGLDLFSGIGGIGQALSPWVRTRAYCERERFPQAVLLSRMERGEIDRAPIWDDVCTLRGDMLPPIDIISGGFPCQDISVAGKAAGIGEGTRSGLYSEIIRLAGELRPAYIFLENVSAITIRGGSELLQTLPKRGMAVNGSLYQLPMLELPTVGRDGGAWPTPCASSYKGSGQVGSKVHNRQMDRFYLDAIATAWPTPNRSDYKGANLSQSGSQSTTGLATIAHHHLATLLAGSNTLKDSPQLNPRFVEALLGYKIGVTELSPSATAWMLSVRGKRSKS